jgi:hypothetical protein
MDELRARITADVSSFMAGINTSAEATSYLKEATEQLKAAKKDLASVEAQLGAAAQAGSQAAKTAIADYTEQVVRAQAYVSALSDRIKELNVSLLSNGSGAGIASSEMRVLSGSMMGSARAAGQFLAIIPGINAAMSAMLPIFGAAGLVMVAVQAAHAIGGLVDAFVALSAAERQASLAAMDAGEKIIKVSATSKTESFARWMEGMPASKDVSVQNAQEALKQIGYQRQLADVAAQNAEAGKTGAALQRQKTIDLEKEAGFAKDAAAQAQKIYDTDRAMLSATMTTKDKSWWGLFGETEEHPVISDPTQVNAIKSQMLDAQRAVAQFQQDAKVAQAKIPGVNQKEGIDATKEAEKAALKQARANDIVRLSITQMEVQERFLTQAHEALERTWEEGHKADEEAAVKAAKAEKEREEQWKKAHEEKLKTIHEETEATVRQADATRQQQDRAISYSQRTGALTKGGGASASIEAVNQEEATKVSALQAEQSNYNPAYGPQDAEKFQQIQDQITQIQQKAALQREQIAQAEAEAQTQKYNQMFNQLYAPLQTFTDHWLTNGSRMGAAFAKMGDQYAMSVINALMKIGAQELIGLALHTAVGDQQRLSDAKTAAAGAYAATAGVPFIGPVLAPAAAAGAFAAVAAFDVGADSVPSTGLAMVHRNEMIFRDDQRERVIGALEGGGKGGDNHFHYSPQISGIDGASVAGMARSHSGTFFRQAARMMRLAGGQ